MYDEVTELQNNINRWYNPKLGKWLSEDPIGFEGGDTNIYRYVGSNVITQTDPDGLKAVKTGVQYCKAYLKGDLPFGVISTHWFIKIDGIGYGKYEKDLNAFGVGEIRDQDHVTYPTVDPATLEVGEPYSVCEDFMIDSDCYDLKSFRQEVFNLVRFPAGDYAIMWDDCQTWAGNIIENALKNSRICDNTWGAFFKCTGQYATDWWW